MPCIWVSYGLKRQIRAKRRVVFSFYLIIINRWLSDDLIGMLVDVGTRDESLETSGSLLALKNTYLKTLKHTNETINYGMIQMSGGDMQMEYD